MLDATPAQYFIHPSPKEPEPRCTVLLAHRHTDTLRVSVGWCRVSRSRMRAGAGAVTRKHRQVTNLTLSLPAETTQHHRRLHHHQRTHHKLAGRARPRSYQACDADRRDARGHSQQSSFCQPPPGDSRRAGAHQSVRTATSEAPPPKKKEDSPR